ncbi:MAG: hypothetical protein ACK5NG_12125 [Chthoniobacterales bacterium]
MREFAGEVFPGAHGDFCGFGGAFSPGKMSGAFRAKVFVVAKKKHLLSVVGVSFGKFGCQPAFSGTRTAAHKQYAIFREGIEHFKFA